MTKSPSPSAVAREPVRTVHPDPIHPKARTVEIIDTDFHFRPSWQTMRRYMPEPFSIGVMRYPPGGATCNPGLAIERLSNGQDVLGVAETAEDMMRVIDSIGVDTVVFSPGFTGPQSLFNEPLISNLASAYNDFVRNEVLPASDRFKAEIMVNQRDPAAAAAEIRRVASDERFVSVFTEFNVSCESLGSAKNDPILEACAEFGLPISIHVGSFFPVGSPLGNGVRTWTELLGFHTMSILMAYLGSLIMQGAFDKYPGLQVLLKEGGCWWVPDFMLRCDEFYKGHAGDIRYVERKLETGDKFLNRMPSEYMLDNVRFATQPICLPPDEAHLAALMRVCHGEDLFCYSSDWPHATFDPANWVFEHPRVLDEALQKKILSGNARKLFKRL